MTPEPPEPDAPPAPPPPVAPPAHPPHRTMVVEFLVVLGLAVVPDLTIAILSLAEPSGVGSYPAMLAFTLARGVQVGGVVLYLMARSPESFAGFGLRRWRPVRDTLLGLALFFAVWGSHFILWHFLFQLPGVADLVYETGGEESVFVSPGGAIDTGCVVGMSIATAFTEQLVVSAYFLTRLRALWNNPALAAMVAAALFSSYHIYQGVWAIPSIFLGGLIFAAVFLLTRRLWPLVIAHAAYDISAFLLA